MRAELFCRSSTVIPVTSTSIVLHRCNIVFTIPTYASNQEETTELIAELLQKQSKHQASEMFQTLLLKPLKKNLLHALE